MFNLVHLSLENNLLENLPKNNSVIEDDMKEAFLRPFQLNNP